LPKVDTFIDRERLDSFFNIDKHKIILNGWFMHEPNHWPPASKLDPLMVSMHITREIDPSVNFNRIPPASMIFSEVGIEYFKKHSPIGARDLDTLSQLQERGIDAYFSGCLTLTLRGPSKTRSMLSMSIVK
jgi:hypothetical protein